MVGIIIIAAVVILIGRIFVYQYFATQKTSSQTQVRGEQQNQVGCNTDSDCHDGASCMTEGPIIANQPVHKVCVPRGQAVPL